MLHHLFRRKESKHVHMSLVTDMESDIENFFDVICGISEEMQRKLMPDIIISKIFKKLVFFIL